MAVIFSQNSLSDQVISEPLFVPPQQATVPPSGNYKTDALLSGYSWDNPTTISYSFLSGAAVGSYYGSETVSELSGAIISNVRTILETIIEPLINVNFVEVADSASSYGQMRYMFSNGPSYAYAYQPFSSANPIAGDVHLSSNYETDSVNRFSGNLGNHGYMTLIHETLHGLGLKHPGDYNGNGTGEPPFLPFREDNTTNTVMTYNFTGNSAANPMPYDISALQYIYGAKALNDTDTTYSFSSVYGYTANGKSSGSSTTPTKLTIWDTGGIDTLNFSALSSNASGYRFDLRERGINTTQSAYNGTSYIGRGDASATTYQTSTNGTAIAYNAVIENILGSSSNDIINGNDVSNNLSGNGGNDSLVGGAGNDILDGGLGSDTLFGGLGNDTYIISSYTTLEVAEENLNEGTDTVQSAVNWSLGVNQENLTLTGNSVINGTGNALNNTIIGNSANNSLDGAAGNDTLIGGAGIDTLGGGIGDDSLTGGAGADILTGNPGKDRFVFTAKTQGRDTITDFSIVDDTINVSKLGFGGGLIAGAAITAAQFKLGSAAGDSSDRFIYNKANGALFFDADGTGAGASLQFAKLSTNLAMTNNDIFVIA